MKQNLQIKFFLLLALAMVGSSNVWGKIDRSWRAATAVGAGKGTATVTMYTVVAIEYTGDSKSTSSNSIVAVTASQSVTLKSSLIKHKCKYSASPSTGYSFSGWYSSSSCTGTASSTTQSNWEAKGATTDSWDVTYYAKFTPNQYTVTFNATTNGGTCSTASKKVTFDGTYGDLPTPTKPYFTFKGWYDAASGGNKITSSTKVSNASNHTLYAQWETATFYAFAGAWPDPVNNAGGVWISINNGWPGNYTYGKEDTSSKTFSDQTSVPTVTANYQALANDGYAFIGWYTAANGGGTKTSSNAKYSENYSATSKESGSPTSIVRYAYFQPSAVNSVNTPASIAFSKAGSATTNVVFNVTNADAVADFNYSVSGDGWAFDSWSYSSNQVTIVVRYTATTSIAKGAHNGTVTLTSKGNSSSTKSATVTANVDLTPTLTYNNGSCLISLNETSEKITLDLNTLKTAYSGDGTITYALKEANSNVVINGSAFYSKQAGNFVVVATASAVSYYQKSVEFTVTVNKLTPVISWKSYDHIYAGDILEDVASTSYKGNPISLTKTYSNVSGSFVVNGNELHIDKQFTTAHDATVRVTTTETDYFAQKVEDHNYYLESKALPKFYLNGVEMSTETTNNLVLKIGETANVSFDQVVESDFTYTSNAQFVNYEHNSSAHTGVITGIAFGNEGFQFHQAGTTLTFDRTCQMHIWVNKHEITLSSPINNNDVWLVDSIYTGATYTIIDDGYTAHAQEEVVVESDNEAVLRHMQDGSWKAVGAGTATLTIRQLQNGYWTGDTITRVIKVEKHTPVITWNVPSASYAWGSVINNPATSSNTDIPFTITSSNTAIANYVNGHIEVYNTTGNVTFTLAQAGNDKWNVASTNLQKSFSTFQPANHVPFTLSESNKGNFEQSKSDDAAWNSNGYKLGNGGWTSKTNYVIIKFTGIPNQLSFTKTLSKSLGQLPGSGQCNGYVYESADGSSWSQCWNHGERVETVSASNVQLQPTTRYIKFEYNGTVYCTYSNINVTEHRGIEPVVSSLDFSTGYNGNTATKRSVDVNWYSVMPCQVTITGTDAAQFYVADDSKTISSSLDNSGLVTLNVFYKHEENKTHNAVLTITSGDNPAYQATINLSGTTTLAPQDIIWRDDITPLPHDGGVYEGAAWASSNGEVVLTSDDENIVKVVGNGLQPVAVGSTTVHAYQAGDGVKWAEVNAAKTIEVTSLSVQHLVWNDKLNNIKRAEGQTVNITLTAQSDAIATDPTLVVTYDLDDDAKAFASVSGNQLTITGWGTGYITAKQVGNANFVPAQMTKKLISRNPDADCKMLAGEYTDEYTLHTIASKEIDITNGEPSTIEFDAKMDWSAIGEGMHLAEYYGGAWHEFHYIDWDKMHSSYTHYGPFNLHRNATKVKLYTNTSATMTRTFKNVEIALARYLELAQNDMSFASVDRGSFLDQTFYINYSNLRGTLDVKLKNNSNNLQVLTETVGEECGEIGQMVAVTIRCNGVVVGTENNTIVLSNKEQSLEVPVTATVVPASQNITWAPETNILTTATVAMDATCTSNLPITYSSKNTDVATVQQDGLGNWSMTIIKDGEVTITANQAGNDDWSAASKDVTFTISKATPEVITWGTPSEVTKWSALSTSIISGGEASVAGTFAWQDGTTSVERGNSGYPMNFVPTNSNWYNTVTQNIVVPVAKDPQTITWNYTPEPMYCNADVTFDATASSGLNVRYESSDINVAYVNDNKLFIISGGDVTITAIQDGDDTWATASMSKDLTILRWTPTIATLPIANSMLIGQHLDNATLNGGVAEVDSKKVDGSFAWKDGSTTTIDVAGTYTRTVTFTPSNPNHYNPTTCEVEVEVKKYAPTMTNNLHASTITYGDALSASSFSGTLVATDNVKYPAVQVAGTYAWKTPSKKLNAGNRKALVTFTPNDMDWYEAVDVEVPIIVNKAMASTATAVSNILYGQILDEAVPVNTTADAVEGVIEGKVKWNVSEAELQEYPTIGNHEYDIALEITDPNYVNMTIFGKGILTVEPGFAFDGHHGTTNWSDPLNWKGDATPTNDGKVIVMADAVIINSTVNVGAITIKNDVNVTIEDGGQLNVGEYDCVKRAKYGNMIVKEGGQVNLHEGEVELNNLFIESSLGGTNSSTKEHIAAKSGQIDNAANLHVNGAAYFDLALDANGACTQGWYDFTVPFPVNASTGVQRFENGTLRTNLQCEKNYAIMTYHEDVRAQGKYGWAKYHGVMQPGQCYSITIDDYHNVYRFVKTKDGALNTSTEVTLTATEGEGGAENKGWNCIGNGTCNYANIAATGISKVQIYDHATNAYNTVDLDGKTFVVGSAIFVQAPESGSILFNKAETEGTLYAPRREARATEEFAVTLSHTNSEQVADRLYLSASEDATDSYEIGHDLAKFGVSTTAAQMWCSAYNMQLCDVELPLDGDNATFPIAISAPKAGMYTINMVQGNADARLYLLHKGNIVADLSMSDYTLNLNKGTNSEYQLQLVAERKITTDIDEPSSETKVEKMIINNQLYIFREGKIYDATGKCVK